MNQVDRLLRATIAELAGEMSGSSRTLAAKAISQGRRLRRRHRLAVMGVAVVVCAGIAAPSAVVAHHLSAASGTHGLPGGWIVLGKGDEVYDRRSGAFVTVPHTGGEAVQPAPAGRRVLVYTPPNSLQFIDVDGSNPVTVNADSVLGGAPFSGDPFSGTFQWSPEGDRVLATIDQKEPFQMGFAIIDAQTGTETKHWIDHGTRPAVYDCSECSFTWTRDGKQVVLPIADRSGGEARDGVRQLQLFDATTGAPTRTLPVPAVPTGPFSWSPDGRYVLARQDPRASQLAIVDVATGTSRPFPYTQAVWATNDRLLATNATTVYTLTRTGTAIATMTVNLGAGNEPITVGPPS